MSKQKPDSNYNTNVSEYLTNLIADWKNSERNFKAYIGLLSDRGYSYQKIANLLKDLNGKEYTAMTIMRWIKSQKEVKHS